MSSLDDLLNTNPAQVAVATCAYCGWAEKMPMEIYKQSAMAHADICEKHPRRALEVEVKRLRDSLSESVSKADAAERETEAIRTLMNLHNLGGWTDALAPMRRALAAEEELVQVRAALNECDLGPHGTLADRVRNLTKHHREWKDLYAGAANRAAESSTYAEALLRDARTILRGFDEGVFIREVAHDAESGWAVKLIPYMQALGRLAANVNPETMPPDAPRESEIGTGTNQRQGADSPASATTDPSGEQDKARDAVTTAAPPLNAPLATPGAQSAPATPSCVYRGGCVAGMGCNLSGRCLAPEIERKHGVGPHADPVLAVVHGNEPSLPWRDHEAEHRAAVVRHMGGCFNDLPGAVMCQICGADLVPSQVRVEKEADRG